MHTFRSLGASLGLGLLAGGVGAQSTEPAVFVVHNVSDTVASFTIAPDGQATFVGIFPASDGPQAVDVSPNGRWLAVGHGTGSDTTEALLVYEVMPDASLDLAVDDLVPDSPLDLAWITDTVLAVVETSVGGSNFVRTYEVDPEVGTLTEIDAALVGTFCSSIAFDPAAGRIFAGESWSQNAIHVVDVASDGELTPVGVTITGSYPLGLEVSPDGSHLYAGGGISSGGHAILGFLAAGEGDLTPLPGSPYTSPGESPKGAAVSDDGQWLYASHGTDSTIRGFEVQADGSLVSTGYTFDVGSQGTLGDLKSMGNFVFATDSSTVSDDQAGLYVFAIQADGDLQVVGGLHDTQGTRPQQIAAWPGAADAQPAELSDFDVVFGTHLSGGLPELGTSDDAYLVARSSIGFTAMEPNLMELVVGAQTEVSDPSTLAITIEQRFNQPIDGGSTIRLRNWNTGSFNALQTVLLTDEDTTHTLTSIPASGYVRDADGRIDLSVKHVAVATFSAIGFESSFDLVGIDVE